MARSLAFWLETDEGDEISLATDVELHFNYWSLSKHNINYLDIGVRLKNSSNFKTINFYLPFDDKSIKYRHELAGRVCSNDELISAIFNSPFSNKTSISREGYYDINFLLKKEDDRDIRFFTHLQLHTDKSNSGVTITPEASEPHNKGFIISFSNDMFSHNDNYDSYFRFRIELSQKEIYSILTKDRPIFSAITNNHEVSETIDFRVNEIRNLPENVRKYINHKNVIQKIHFFLIRESRAEYKISHTNYKRCRILENDLWGDYINIDQAARKKEIKEQMLIYHWTTKDGEVIDHFSAFAKFSSKSVRWLQIIAVLLVTLLTGFFSSLFTNYVWQKVDNLGDCADNREVMSPDASLEMGQMNNEKQQSTKIQEESSK